MDLIFTVNFVCKYDNNHDVGALVIIIKISQTKKNNSLIITPAPYCKQRNLSY